MQSFTPPRGATRTAVVRQPIRTEVPVVTETITATAVTRETRTTDVGKESSGWSAEDLRNYVVREIEKRFGPFPQKEPFKILAIFQGFVRRHGEMAGPIAECAFETFGGYWKGAPIAVQRFCAGSDPYFADEIRERLIG